MKQNKSHLWMDLFKAWLSLGVTFSLSKSDITVRISSDMVIFPDKIVIIQLTAENKNPSKYSLPCLFSYIKGY